MVKQEGIGDLSLRIWIDKDTHRIVHIQRDYSKHGTPTIYVDNLAFWKSTGKLMIVT